MNTYKSSSNVRVAERIVSILDAFTFTTPELSFTEICNIVCLPKATVHRLISTLEDMEFLVQNVNTGKWRLGGELMRLGAVAQASNEVAQVAKQDMEQLVKKTKQTCNLYALRNYERICIAQEAGLQYVPRYSFLGAVYPLYCGAGKVFLAYQSDRFLEQYFKNVKIEKLTENTVTDIAKIIEELAAIRKTGWSVSLGERDPMTASVSAPIFDYTQHIAAVITVSGPVQFFTQERLKRFAADVQVTCERISKKLGFDSMQKIVF